MYIIHNIIYLQIPERSYIDYGLTVRRELWHIIPYIVSIIKVHQP